MKNIVGVCLCGLVLASAAGPTGCGGNVEFPAAKNSGAPARPPAPVTVAEAAVREVAPERTYVGNARALRTSAVASEVEGWVLNVFAREGDYLEEGGLIAWLDSTQSGFQLESARAELDLRTAELDELRNGALPEEIDQARARLNRARAEYDFRLWKLTRTTDLHAKGSATDEELQNATWAERQASTQLVDAQAALALLQRGTRDERIAQAEALERAAAAEVRRLENLHKRHLIEAPFAGYVVERRVESGEWLSRGGTAVVLAELDAVEVELAIPEEDTTRLSLDAPVVLRFDAAPERGVSGRVTSLVPIVDPRSRTVALRIVAQNPLVNGLPLIKAGASVRGTLALSKPRRALVVPKDALVLERGAGSVVVIDLAPEGGGIGTPRHVTVKMGVATADVIEVIGALKEGELVAVLGNERIFPGMAVVVTGRIPTEGRVPSSDNATLRPSTPDPEVESGKE